ncbi:transcription elongation factor subunit Spt4 [Desulfurococcus amylolyticus]|uniref:Transcription elongation factor Spt4 n=1 Tax=Desulfurococcus amylolyticus DSM 16532 TaxID=768672 RepID=I3XTN1_DESAM|nr:transcription elongation factor subunit Spt4 [Desulfurococcus amylolyticus]AFL67305.1 DNA-directed RNA polymerase, subunit E'' [Desulfurococcus amylolyticus DSM 16532]
MSSRGKSFKACRRCRSLVPKNAETCPVCGSQDFTFEWNGIIIIVNPEKSLIAKILEINNPGKYVIKLE